MRTASGLRLRSTFVSAVLLFGVLGAAVAEAYVPPPDYQLQQLVKRHNNVKSVRVRSRLTDGQLNLKETLWYDSATRTLRGRIEDDAGQTVYTYQKKLGENGISASSFLFETNVNALLKSLAAGGVDLSGEADSLGLGRVRQLIGWTIGRNPPSLWVQKDEFFPLKWIPKVAGGNPEVIFEETKFQRDFPYSRLITVVEDKKEILRLEAIEVSLNPDLSDLKSTNFRLDEAPQLKVIEDLLAWIR